MRESTQWAWGRTGSFVLAVVVTIAGAVAPAGAGDGAADFRAAGGWAGEPADWVSVDYDRIAFGRGSRVHLAVGIGSPALVRSIDAGVEIRDAVLVEQTLYVNDGTRIGRLDLDEAVPTLSPLRLSPQPRRQLTLTRMIDFLIVAESGVGLRVIELPPPKGMPHMDHHAHVMQPTQIALHELKAEVLALAATGNVVYALVAPGRVLAVDFKDPERPRSRTIAVERTTHALAANGTTLYTLSGAGLSLIDVSPAGPRTISNHPDVVGRALHYTGRSIQIAARDGGLQTFIDRAAGAAIVDVTVGSNFFSPPDVTVEAGDTVRWTKGGGFHNVESCSSGQGAGRCGGLSSQEVFRSGDPTFDPFQSSHMFTIEGTHEYICVIHAFAGTGMVGSVTVGGGPSCGDGQVDPLSEDCDDGNVISGDGCESDCTFTLSGEVPATVLMNKSAGDVTLMWDPSCLGSDSLFGIYEGQMGSFTTYSSISCNNAGTQATFVPNVNDVFYLVVPRNPASEGSYGRDGDGTPRATGTSTCATQRLASCP